MKTRTFFSQETQRRYFLNAVMFLLLIGVAASSLYFLYVPAGYQGGRNPRYNMQIIFSRETWDEIHVWTSFILSAVLFIHLIFHWSWLKNSFWLSVKNMKRNLVKNRKAFFNIIDDILAALSFLVCLASGLVLFFIPGGRGTSTLLFMNITREVWKTIHIWSGIGMLAGVLFHLVIHWGWVRKVSRKLFRKTEPAVQNVAA